MKIIKEGDLELKRAVRTFECDECGCLWEADRTEYVTETDFRNGHVYVMDCPTCGRRCYGEHPKRADRHARG